MFKYLRPIMAITTSLLVAIPISSYAGSSLTICPDKANHNPDSAHFVYCGPAVCTPNEDGETATCEGCYTMTGENLGTTSCEDRVPVTNGDGTETWISSFSAKKDLVPGAIRQPVVFCDTDHGADAEYANCLNAECTVDDNKLATCQCTIATAKGLYTAQTRSCDLPNKCNAKNGAILNGAPLALTLPLLFVMTEVTDNTISDLTCASSNAEEMIQKLKNSI